MPSSLAASPLRNAQFRWLLGSNGCFFLALHGQAVVRSWIVFELTGSNLSLGKIAAAVAVPMIVMAPLGGVIADRVERRRLIRAGQLAVFSSELVLLGLLFSGRLLFWHLVVGTAVMGLAFPLILPARQAIVANLVGRQGLTAATALNTGLINASRTLGPMAAGGLIGILGTKVAYSVGVGAYGLAILCLLGVAPLPAPANPTSLPVREDLAHGWRYLISDRLVLTLLVFGLVPMFLAMPAQQLFVVFAERVWRVGPGGFGVLQGIAGVGGVSGALLVLRRRTPRRLAAMVGSALGFVALLASFSLCPRFGPALALLFAAYACAAVFTALNSAAIQLLVPDRVRGRVSSFMLMSVSLPLLGTLPVGALADLYGAPTAVAGGCGVAALAVVAFRSLSPALRSLDARVLKSLDHRHAADPVPYARSG